jgi:predicted HicB family RNase H-like nuclease
MGRIFSKRGSVRALEPQIRKVSETEYEVKLLYPTRLITVRLTNELYEKLTAYAKAKRISMSDVVRRALEEYLSNQNG